MADYPLTPGRAQTIAHAIRIASAYDLAEVADLLDALAAQLVARDARARDAPTLVGAAEAGAAFALLARLPSRCS